MNVIFASGIFIFCSLGLGLVNTFPQTQYSWPHGRIPFEDDPALIQDPDQAVALNNARMDLQVRSCVKFIPRRMENDYVFFTDLGPQVECWNMFHPFPKGKIQVNAGPACLEPMRRPHRPKRVFSECDVDYVNKLFNCPQKRKVPPVCTPNENMMGPPRLLATTESTTTTTTTTTIETTEQQSTTEASNEIPMVEREEEAAANENQEIETTTLEVSEAEPEETTVEWSPATEEIALTTTEQPAEPESEKTDEGEPEDEDATSNSNNGNELVEAESSGSSMTGSVVLPMVIPPNMHQTTQEPDITTVMPSLQETTEFEEEEEEITTTTTPEPTEASTETTETPSKSTTDTTPPPPTTMFISLITSTPMTTMEVQPAEWVKSVEESFRNRMPDESSSTEEKPEKPQPEIKPSEDKVGSVKLLKVKSTETNEDNKPAVVEKGKSNEKLTEKSSESEERKSVDLPGGSISVSKTKISTMIERTKYVGPCGSACNYNGDLVKLFRSYNDKPGVTDHFYTTDRLEHHLMASEGYIMQPHMGYLGRNHVDPNCTCIKPLYRLYSEFMKDHLLTSTEQEKNIAESILGYKFEKLLGYCTKEPGCGAYLPLYRFYNPINKDHLYTVDQMEMHYYRTHPEQAYSFEYIECYVWQNNSSRTTKCPAVSLITDSRFARL